MSPQPTMDERLLLTQAAFDAINHGMVLHSAEGPILLANQAASSILGLSIDQLMGRTSMDPNWRAIHADGSPWPGDTHPAVVTLTTGTEVSDAIMGVHRPDGSLVWLAVSSRPAPLPGGTVGAAAMFVDITASLTDLRRMRMLFDDSGVPTWITAPGTDKIVTVNGALTEWLGYTREELEGAPSWAFVHPEDIELVRSARAEVVDGRRPRIEVRYVAVDGTVRWGMATGIAMADPATGVELVMVQAVDVTERVLALAELRKAHERFEVTFHSAPGGTALVDLATRPGHVIQANWALAQLTGLRQDDLVAGGVADLVDPADRPGLLDVLDELSSGFSVGADVEARISGPGGDGVWVTITLASVLDDRGNPSYAVAQFEDITARRDREALLAWQSTHDSLTGLANRTALATRLESALGSPGGAASVALLFCDLDGFKDVNDVLGHAAGDAVLTAVARRLEATVRPSDLVVRLGGDEFVILLERIGETIDLERIAHRVVEAIALPITVDGGSAMIGVSVGCARPSSSDPDELIVRADEAMYEAKASGRSRFVIAPY